MEGKLGAQGDLNPAPGDTYTHVRTGKRYRVVGVGWDAARDETVVAYTPEKEVEGDSISLFTRPLDGHPKSWKSVTEDGKPRFEKAGG